MTIEAGNTSELYDTSRFHEDAREPLMGIAKEALHSFLPSIDQTSLGRFFNVASSLISQTHIEYMKTYAAIVIPQLVVGAYSAPDYDITITSRENQLDAIKKRGSPLFRVNDLWHELAHTVVALGKNKHPNQIESATPHFQKFPERQPKNMSDAEFEKIQQADHAEEAGAAIWEYLSDRRKIILELIQQAKKDVPGNTVEQEKQFIRLLGKTIKRDIKDPDQMDSYTRTILGRVFREYGSNKLLTMQIFMDTTAPLMKRYKKGT